MALIRGNTWSDIPDPKHKCEAELGETVTHPLTGQPLTGQPWQEVAVVGPDGDYSWGIFDPETAQAEVNRLNALFNVIARF